MAYKINEDLYIGNTNKQLKDLFVPVHDAYSTSTTDSYSCNYINNIVESGSNANGSWIKWADGTMICHKFLTGGLSASLWANGIYYRDISNGNWPQKFKSIFNCQVTNTTNQWWCCVSEVSETSAGTTRLIRPDKGAGHSYNVHLLAIGNWK